MFSFSGSPRRDDRFLRLLLLSWKRGRRKDVMRCNREMLPRQRARAWPTVRQLLYAALQSLKAVSAYLKSKKLLPSGFARQSCWRSAPRVTSGSDRRHYYRLGLRITVNNTARDRGSSLVHQARIAKDAIPKRAKPHTKTSRKQGRCLQWSALSPVTPELVHRHRFSGFKET